MEASHRKLSAAVLLLISMAAEMGLTQAKECLFQSAKFRGPCYAWSVGICNDKCLDEDKANTGGKCHGWELKCMCIKPC
ncbi:defensin-like protein 5 [Sorghum bicolor]|nr:defensin-like protein 5 [Sorghum bicolor]|eukprot:XP_021310670.1 defensin-like protein 5 [Sorghum bicolor]